MHIKGGRWLESDYSKKSNARINLQLLPFPEYFTKHWDNDKQYLASERGMQVVDNFVDNNNNNMW